MTTNEAFLRVAFQETHVAADEITMLSQRVDSGACITSAELLPKVRSVRNALRRAHSAMETLKQRAKEQNRKAESEKRK